MKTETKSPYELETEKFLRDAGATFTAKFLYHGPHFPDDRESRDVYEITLTRGDRKPYTFKFGQSIANSRNYNPKPYPGESIYNHEQRKRGYLNPPKAPSAYDVLTCLTKYDPDTFENFCAEFGYDSDSRKAEKTYFAVQEEWSNVRRLFGDVLEKLQEIQ